eukprot:g73719.t1
MSVLKKLEELRMQKESSHLDQGAFGLDTDSDEEDTPSSRPAEQKQKPASLFADEEEEEPEEVEDIGRGGQKSSSRRSKGKRQKQKRGRRTGTQEQVEKAKPSSPPAGKNGGEEEEDLDSLLSEFGVGQAGLNNNLDQEEEKDEKGWAGGGASSRSLSGGLFDMSNKHFNMEMEVKQKFGVDVKLPQEVVQRKGKGRPTSSTRNNLTLLSGSQHFPRIRKPFHMALTARQGGLKYFTFSYSKEYEIQQQEYLAAVATYQPEQIGMHLQRYPFHVDAALQMAYLLECQGDHGQAHGLVERALYSYEVSFAPEFNLLHGNCRIDLASDESPNITFLKALARHAQLLGKKGCVRTALEVSKLLLSLAPEADPMGSLLSLDYYALRSGEYLYLLSFARDFPSRHGAETALYPNLLLSAALAAWHLEAKGSSSLPASSDALLRRACLLVPEVFTPLLNVVGEREASGEVWRALLPRLLALHTAHPLAEKLAAIYVERSAILWKAKGVLEWLRAMGSRLLTDMHTEAGSLEVTKAKEERAVVYSRDRPVPLPIKQLQKSQYSDHVPQIPAEFRQQQLPAANFPPADPAHAIDLQGHPLRALIMSILPWIQLQVQGEVVVGPPDERPPPPEEGD